MISEQHFQYEVGHDDRGPIVTVTHIPTNRRKIDRPTQGERVSDVQRRLKGDLLHGFFNVEDYRMDIGRGGSVEGRSGTYFAVTHLPTNRSKQMTSFTSPGIKNRHEILLDLLVEELWREGILPIA